MKKRFAFVLAMILCLSLLTACGGKEETPAATDGEASAGTPEYTFSLSWEASETSVGGMALVYFAEAIEEMSEGRIACNVYQNAQLGTSREVIEGIQSNQVTMMLCTGASQSNFVPDIAIYDCGFSIPNKEAFRALLTDEELNNALRDAYAEAGLYLLGGIDGGFRTLAANKVINTPDDIKGMSLRTQETKWHMATWEAIGANVTPLAFAELYTALEQGTVECQENPVEMLATNRLYEVQEYVMTTNHNVNNYMMIMNKEFYDSLPADLQKVVNDAYVYAYENCLEYLDTNYEANVQTILDYGCTMPEMAEENLQKFVDAAKPVWEQIKTECSDEVWDAYFAVLENY